MKRKLFPLALLLLSGCASYQATSLSRLDSDAIETNSGDKIEHIYITAKAFNKADCKRYLDRDVLAKGYQPVQLFIENNTNEHYLFSHDRINLPYASSEEVARTVHTSTMGRILGYGIPGVLIAFPLVIPAVVDGIKSFEANEALDRDFYTKTAVDRVIAPKSTLNRLLFVPRSEYQPTFTVTLIEQESKKIKTFTVSTS
jgi:hypothetical protein